MILCCLASHDVLSRGSVICHLPIGKNDNDDTCIPVIEMHKMTKNDNDDTLLGSQ